MVISCRSHTCTSPDCRCACASRGEKVASSSKAAASLCIRRRVHRPQGRRASTAVFTLVWRPSMEALLAVLADPQVWIAFFTLTALELVLGIDNIIFISILVDKLPGG